MNLPLFLQASIFLMVSWLLLAMSFFSWGRFFSRRLNIKIDGKKGIIANIWLGFIFSIIFFSIYHLFLPINAFASSIFYFPGIIYFFIKYGKKLPDFVKSIGSLKISVIVLTLFIASAVAIQLPTNFDAGLYHLNSIRWNNEYHIVKGLGNLHTRLGFNQSFFLFCASLNFHPFLNEYGFHASNSFLFALFFVGTIIGGKSIDLIFACLFIFIPMPYHWMTSPTPDFASTIIQIITFRYFVEAVHYKPQNKERISIISFVVLLSAILITIKLSNVVYVACLGLITIIFGIKYNFDSSEKKLIGKAFVCIGSFFAIWITRGYIQTGYPLFPSSIGGINTTWTVPKYWANKMENNVYAGSRSCETTFDINSPILKNYAWLPLWIKRNIFDEEIYWSDDSSENLSTSVSLLLFPSTVNNWGIGSLTLCILSIILIAIWAVSVIRNVNSFHKCIILLYLLTAEIISIAFWFFMAPCPRFANGIFICLFVTSLLLIKEICPNLKVNENIKTLMGFYLFIMLVWNFYLGYTNNEFSIDGIKPVVKIPMREFVLKSGLKIFIPQTGAQCWDSQPPSTIEPKLGLSLIGSNMKDGFFIKD